MKPTLVFVAAALVATIVLVDCSSTKPLGKMRCQDPGAALFETEETCLSCPTGFELKAGKSDEDKYQCVFASDSKTTRDPMVKKAIEIGEAERGFFAVSATRGQSAAENYGCFNCHSVDGTPSAGPSWKGLYGSKRRLTDGSVALATESYLRESVLNPGAKKISMPYTRTFRESMPTDMKVSEPDLANIIEYIKTLQ